ncbi:uncharacterized protein LOC128997641 [Macrosteles quadrilineatus]|uniref:uncharacterized protein LOC128997641 n=1 Tax=Macrosteles quadrilineatus TaxID=74068 RepID=UPI0023E34074|nr:uncharacterized protein LOC128997641 [Macrosteles quadrilineatus]
MKNEFGLKKFADRLHQLKVCFNDQSTVYNKESRIVKIIAEEQNLRPEAIVKKINYLENIYLQEKGKVLRDSNYKPITAWFTSADKLFIKIKEEAEVINVEEEDEVIYVEEEDDPAEMPTQPNTSFVGLPDHKLKVFCGDVQEDEQPEVDGELDAFGSNMIHLMAKLPVEEREAIQYQFIQKTTECVNKYRRKAGRYNNEQ